MKIAVLQPDYSTTDNSYKDYAPYRNLSQWLPNDDMHYITLNKLTTYKQLKAAAKQGFDIFINLCEAYLEWEIPSIDVIHSLELLNLPYTGPNPELYDPPKTLMKYVAYCENVLTPNYVVVKNDKEIENALKNLKFPMFVKPAKAGDSLGIDDKSLVYNAEDLREQVKKFLPEYNELLIENYIAGRELTCLVIADGEKKYKTYKSIEYSFPEGYTFKTYKLKIEETSPGSYVAINDAILDKRVRDATQRIFQAFNGVGYARMDFRLDADNRLYFLEANFACSVFYENEWRGSADFILEYDGIGYAGFLKQMIKEGIERHKRKQKKYERRQNSVSGYGIYAVDKIKKGGIVFQGEGKAQRMATKRYIQKHWSKEQIIDFKRYAYPVSDEVYLLWDNNPAEWSPQNHACDANTKYDGLNVVATRIIKKDEELTLDYAEFLDSEAETFECTCGAKNCRGVVRGTQNNSVTMREKREKIKKT